MFGRKPLPSQNPIGKPSAPTAGMAQTQTAQQAVLQHGEPPLFIKLEKYNDLVKNLQELRKYSKEIKETLDSLAEVEKRLTRGITASYRTLDSLDTIISVITMQFLARDKISMPSAALKAKSEEIEKYFSTVREEISKVKTELSNVSPSSK